MNKLIERYIDYISQINSNSEHTKDAYTRDLIHFKDYIDKEHVRYDQVDRQIVLNYIAYLRLDCDLKKSSVARKVSTIRCFYRYLSEYHGLQSNPFALISV